MFEYEFFSCLWLFWMIDYDNSEGRKDFIAFYAPAAVDAGATTGEVNDDDDEDDEPFGRIIIIDFLSV